MWSFLRELVDCGMRLVVVDQLYSFSHRVLSLRRNSRSWEARLRRFVSGLEIAQELAPRSDN